MKADLTRNTLDPFRHFTGVIMQQGRVQLDADWNEQAAILLRSIRTLAADIIGPQGGPVDSVSNTAGGFLISAITGLANDFRIGLGHYYVDGILCEADSRPVAITVQPFTGNTATVQVDHWTLDGSPFTATQFVEVFVEVFDDVQLPIAKPAFSPTVVQITNPQQAQLTLTLSGVPANLNAATFPKLRRVFTYSTQPDYPLPTSAALANGAFYLVYLDVWERLITYVEDDSIREVALGGPDTATRAKVVWQVKTIQGQAGKPNENQSPCDGFIPTAPNDLTALLGVNRGRLKAMAKQTPISTDPCIVSPQASYRGPENQLYRVEIHTGGNAWSGAGTASAGAATFKWSRENGSVVFPIVSVLAASGTTAVVLENLGRDDRFGLAEGEWVEIVDDTYVLQNRAEPLLQVQSIDRPSLKVTLKGTPPSNSKVGQSPDQHPLLRRWDQTSGDPAEGGLQIAPDGAAYILESTSAWLGLENGVQIQFQPPVQPIPKPASPVTNQYVTGDYWLIPARTATGDVEWPTEAGVDSQGNATIVPIAKLPDGVDHHYAPLGVVSLDASGNVTVQGDCRKHFGPLAQR